MARQDNLCLQLCSAGKGRVEVVDFKPQEYTIAMRQFGVADWAVMVFDIPPVQLKNKVTVRNEPLIVRAAMVALTGQETLIPTTARFDIAHANEGLWMHRNFRGHLHKSLIDWPLGLSLPTILCSGSPLGN